MKKFLFYVSLVLFLVPGVLVAADSSVFSSQPEGDKSSLKFTGSCIGNCEYATARVCNDEKSRDMADNSIYHVYYAVSGNPRDGEIVESGIIPALKSGECVTLTATTGKSGNYMFQALQRPGHSGTGVLWSEACNIRECVEPTVTPTPEGCEKRIVINECTYILENTND